MVHLLLLDSTGLRTTGRPGDELVDNLEAPVLDVLVRVEPQPQLTLPGRDHGRELGATILAYQCGEAVATVPNLHGGSEEEKD